jgi:hypothetical protein
MTIRGLTNAKLFYKSWVVYHIRVTNKIGVVRFLKGMHHIIDVQKDKGKRAGAISYKTLR